MNLWGGIEAGGTKFICAVGSSPKNIVAEVTYETKTPTETITKVIEFFVSHQKKFGPLKAIGIGSFGPIDIDPHSKTFGYIKKTPKIAWSNIDLVGFIKKHLDIPIGVDTDVNAAALAEKYWGSAKGLDTFIYLTVGTGIGGGGMINGKLIRNILHPEMGHIMVPHDVTQDPFPGVCTFHGDCLEGLASGPAIEKRWGRKAEELSNDHPSWELEAKYLAYGLVNYIYTIVPQRIIMGGGVMQKRHLLPLIHRNVLKILNGYIQHPPISNGIDDYIVPPALGKKAGILGSIAIAKTISVKR